MPSTSASHLAKRPFQPSITSFFARTDDSDTFTSTTSITSSYNALTSSTASPALPSSVQASLLNVGMRVRKSVPEGYKTHKQAQFAQQSIDVYSAKAPAEPVPAEYTHPRELLPFCGLHKIGGFAPQPVTHPSENPSSHGQLTNGTPAQPTPLHFHVTITPDFSTPSFSSQPSAAASTPARIPNPNPHKRSFDDTAADAHAFRPALPPLLFPAGSGGGGVLLRDDADAPVSPRSTRPPAQLNPLRPFAQPRTRSMRRLACKAQGGDADVEIENAEGVEGMEGMEGRSSLDFGEAEFLTPWEGEGGREVEMGGV